MAHHGSSALSTPTSDEGIATPPLLRAEVRDIILAHLDSLYLFYGEETGVRIARKHLGWYCEQLLTIPGAGPPGSDGSREHSRTVRARG